MDRLIRGHKRVFGRGISREARPVHLLAEGQKPETLFVDLRPTRVLCPT